MAGALSNPGKILVQINPPTIGTRMPTRPPTRQPFAFVSSLRKGNHTTVFPSAGINKDGRKKEGYSTPRKEGRAYTYRKSGGRNVKMVQTPKLLRKFISRSSVPSAKPKLSYD
jgi:hypothetical protein